MKLNGWLRLWIVIVVLYGIVVSFIAFEERPKLSSLEQRWINEASDVIAEKISEKEGKEIASYRLREALFKDKSEKEIINWLKDVVRSPSENQKTFYSSISEVNNKFKKELELLPEEQRSHYVQSVLWWFIPSIFLYIFGWSIGWIIRGFKKDKH